jgi:hypothetical protein
MKCSVFLDQIVGSNSRPAGSRNMTILSTSYATVGDSAPLGGGLVNSLVARRTWFGRHPMSRIINTTCGSRGSRGMKNVCCYMCVIANKYGGQNIDSNGTHNNARHMVLILTGAEPKFGSTSLNE